MRYFLPNKKEIDLDALEAAMLADDGLRRFLDGETGAVVVHEAGRAAVHGDGPAYEYTPSRFFEIPTIDAAERLPAMRHFVKIIMAGEAPALARKLTKALDSENEQRFVELLEADIDGWIDGWAQWKADAFFEEIQSWLASLPVEIGEDPELDMDCLCCRGLASALLTEHAESEFQRMQRAHREARG